MEAMRKRQADFVKYIELKSPEDGGGEDKKEDGDASTHRVLNTNRNTPPP